MKLSALDACVNRHIIAHARFRSLAGNVVWPERIHPDAYPAGLEATVYKLQAF